MAGRDGIDEYRRIGDEDLTELLKGAAVALPSRYWIDLTWQDFADDEAGNWIAVLPLAAVEQHGPHLPLGTDLTIAEAFVRATVAKLPAEIPAVFLPVQAVTLSTEHADFPGTLTLAPDIAIQTWMAIGDSVARAGVRKLVLVSSHGGNSAAMTLTAQELRARLGLFVVTTNWHRFGAPSDLFPAEELSHGIHAGAIETSLMQAAAPHLVRDDAIDNFPSQAAALATRFQLLSTARPAPFAWQAQDLNSEGATGDARLATPDKGQALLDHGAGAFCDLLAEIHRFDPADLRAAPDEE